jgi:NTP pyrophosphatase (non-canonical NTP hydrolase)
MTVLYYQSASRGPLLISEMLFTPLKNAAEKLRREGCPPDREDELAAMDARLAEMAVEYRAKLVAEAADPETAPERMAKIGEELARLDGAA